MKLLNPTEAALGKKRGMYFSIIKAVFDAMLILFLTIPTNAIAAEVKFQAGYTQDNFKDIIQDIGADSSFSSLSVAQSLGPLGFDVTVDVTALKLRDNKEYLRKASLDSDSGSYMIARRIKAYKGLPGEIDIGISCTDISGGPNAIGIGLKKTIVDLGIPLPTISVQADYSQTVNSGELDLSTIGVSALASLVFPLVTPYVGLSASMVMAKANSYTVHLDRETSYINRGFFGARITPFPFLMVAAEASFGGATQYGLNFGIKF